MESTEPVRVAVNIRPLIRPEILNGCTECIAVAPNDPEVHINSHTFTYDYVFGNSGMPSSSIYKHCVAPLVEALFRGYNATVLAYGQTASGKTYTMGTYHSGDETNGGIIQKVMDDVFTRVEATKDSTKPQIQVSFTEIYNEEVFDLLASNPPRAPLQIRETASGEVTLQGVTEAQVRTKEEMSSYLARGSIFRATGSTNMNSKSSRSHAIITISLLTRAENTVRAKLHLVDLAGSERANRTGADGMRMKECIHINKGLLALGTVINTLGDERKRKKGGHVPYRVSKLTRLLQDSLGGNSKTLMIACVSPAITNAEETLNTLRYAHRARNIQNKAVVQKPASSVFDNLNRDGDDLVMSDVCSGSSDSRSQPKPSAPSFDYDAMFKERDVLCGSCDSRSQPKISAPSFNYDAIFKEGTPPGSASLTVYDKPVYDGEDVFEAFSELKIPWTSQSANCDDETSSTSPPSKLRKPIYDDKLVYDEDVVEAIPEHEVPSSSQSARCGDGSSFTSPPSKLRKPVYDDKPVYDEDVVEAIHEPQIPSSSQLARCDDDGFSSTPSPSKLSKPVYDDKPVYDEDVAEAIPEPQIPSTRFDDVSSSSPSKLRKENNFPLEDLIGNLEKREMEPNKAESEREDKDQNKPVEFIDLTADERTFIDLTADETEFQDKGSKHCSLQEKLDMKLKELDKRKAEIRGSYQEKRALQREIECLRQKLSSSSSATPCCTCSKSSTCKTVRCQCVVSNCFCVSSCGCTSLKCSNRSREARLL